VLSVKKQNATSRVALKCLALPESQREWDVERLLLPELKHPNIASISRVISCPKMGLIEMELCSRDLMTVIESNRLPVEDDLKMMFLQICDAVSYCHQKGIAHMDIKPENILVDNDCQIVKLADFGTAVRYAPEKFTQSSGLRMGTFFYCAPEVLNCSDYMPDKADVWSLGVLLYTLVTKTWPYVSASEEEIYNQVSSGRVTLTGNLDPQLVFLLNSIFQVEPQLRPSVEQITSPPWFEQKSKRRSVLFERLVSYRSLTKIDTTKDVQLRRSINLSSTMLPHYSPRTVLEKTISDNNLRSPRVSQEFESCSSSRAADSQIATDFAALSRPSPSKLRSRINAVAKGVRKMLDL
jgi:serine/threonine protein kinase